MSHTAESRIRRQFVLMGPDNLKIFRVDGTPMRRIDADAIGGVHGYCYVWMSKDEIWMEKMKDGRKEEAFLLAHEMVEVLMMKYLGWGYAKAHAKATDIERVLREGAPSAWVFSLFVMRYFGNLRTVTAAMKNQWKLRLNATYVHYRNGV